MKLLRPWFHWILLCDTICFLSIDFNCRILDFQKVCWWSKICSCLPITTSTYSPIQDVVLDLKVLQPLSGLSVGYSYFILFYIKTVLGLLFPLYLHIRLYRMLCWTWKFCNFCQDGVWDISFCFTSVFEISIYIFLV